MHNRVRMIVASFLVKDLMIPWQEGARWIWDTLVDADLANNTFGWQWTAGCGADAAPYFRIFNPMSQGEKFAPKGKYVRRWVPELAPMPTKNIHEPWSASDNVLRRAGIELGKDYPYPIVDHTAARKRAPESRRPPRRALAVSTALGLAPRRPPHPLSRLRGAGLAFARCGPSGELGPMRLHQSRPLHQAAPQVE